MAKTAPGGGGAVGNAPHQLAAAQRGLACSCAYCLGRCLKAWDGFNCIPIFLLSLHQT